MIGFWIWSLRCVLGGSGFWWLIMLLMLLLSLACGFHFNSVAASWYSFACVDSCCFAYGCFWLCDC